MKRGFLLNTKTKKAKDPSTTGCRAPDNATATTPSPQDIAILQFDHIPGTFKFKVKLSKPGDSVTAALICTRVTSSPADARGTTECALVPETKRLLSMVPKHPRSPISDPSPKAYSIHPTAGKGLGMFAQRKLDVGDLIVVERPLVVLPSLKFTKDFPAIPEELMLLLRSKGINKQGIPTHGMARLQAVLEVLFERMTKEDQDAFTYLANAYVHEGHSYLLGRMRTNAFGLGDLGLGDDLRRYDAICRDVSRVNHSCRPNCALTFDATSFSVELRATKTINKGEEILLSYCPVTLPTRERQAQLSDYNFVCTCYSCKPTPSNPSNDVIRTSVLKRIKHLEDNVPEALRPDDPAESLQAIFANPLPSHAAVKKFRKDIIVLMEDMVAEGMEGSDAYLKAMELYGLANVGHSMTTLATVPTGSEHRAYADTRLQLEGMTTATAMQMMDNYQLAHYGSAHNEVGVVKRLREKFGFMSGRM